MEDVRYSASFVVGLMMGLLLIMVLKDILPEDSILALVFKLLIIGFSINLIALIVESQNARISRLRGEKKQITQVFKKIKIKMDRSFPNGEKDINAAASELLNILNNLITLDQAKEIVSLSVGIGWISGDFTKERLESHLAGYCLHYFTDSQVEEFHRYLTAITTAMIKHGKSPSEVKRHRNSYFW